MILEIIIKIYLNVLLFYNVKKSFTKEHLAMFRGISSQSKDHAMKDEFLCFVFYIASLNISSIYILFWLGTVTVYCGH